MLKYYWPFRCCCYTSAMQGFRYTAGEEGYTEVNSRLRFRWPRSTWVSAGNRGNWMTVPNANNLQAVLVLCCPLPTGTRAETSLIILWYSTWFSFETGQNLSQSLLGITKFATLENKNVFRIVAACVGFVKTKKNAIGLRGRYAHCLLLCLELEDWIHWHSGWCNFFTSEIFLRSPFLSEVSISHS